MSLPRIHSSHVKVICEQCIHERSDACILCAGRCFYYWDPQSGVCYDAHGGVMQIEDEHGDRVTVVRRTAGERTLPDLATMMTCIELWVRENPVRKWKLWVDDGGWHCSLWFNRYKKDGFDCSEVSVDKCVASAFQKVLATRTA